MQERLRMCIVCHGRSDKKELVRLVKNKDGEIFLDKTGKANGRGAYVCKSKDCFDKLKKTRALNRAFKCEIPLEIYEKLGEEIENS
ncbi:MAG TPA: YlxR family protein [Candidatus Caccovivens faecavium]|nr:YlxR family protein [Candidatus Caccovivens faecavium]